MTYLIEMIIGCSLNKKNNLKIFFYVALINFHINNFFKLNIPITKIKNIVLSTFFLNFFSCNISYFKKSKFMKIIFVIFLLFIIILLYAYNNDFCYLNNKNITKIIMQKITIGIKVLDLFFFLLFYIRLKLALTVAFHFHSLHFRFPQIKHYCN